MNRNSKGLILNVSKKNIFLIFLRIYFQPVFTLKIWFISFVGPILKVLYVKDHYIFHPLNRGEKRSKIHCGVQMCKLCFINFILMAISLSYDFCTRFCGNSKISDITKIGHFRCTSTSYQMYLIFAKFGDITDF